MSSAPKSVCLGPSRLPSLGKTTPHLHVPIDVPCRSSVGMRRSPDRGYRLAIDGPNGPDLPVIYETAAFAPLQQVTVHVLRCSGHQETSGSNTTVSALKSGRIGSALLD